MTPSTTAGAKWEQPCPSVTFSCPGVAHMLHQGQVLQLWGCVRPHRGAGHNRDVCDPYLLSRTFGVCPGSATSLQAACLSPCVPPQGTEVSCTAGSRKKKGKPSSALLSPPVSTHYLGGHSLVRTWSSPPFVHQFHKNKQKNQTTNRPQNISTSQWLLETYHFYSLCLHIITSGKRSDNK